MTYEEPQLVTRAKALHALESESPEQASEALLSVALHESDRLWAEQVCMKALQDQRRDVVAAAIISIGHIARLHRQVGSEVVPALRDLSKDPKLAGLVEDALDDILTFVGRLDC